MPHLDIWDEGYGQDHPDEVPWKPEEWDPDPETLPPNSRWDTKTQKWIITAPGEEGYDPTWGGDRVLDPWGDTESDRWLKSTYEAQGWTLPPKSGVATGTDVDDGEARSDLPQPEYKYYGTDPYQDWDVDLGYLRDAPTFEFEAEPWVEPEAFTYPAYERLPSYEKPEAFSYEPFTAPTAEEVLTEDPGYQFRLGEGLRAFQGRAAKKGTLLGGATIKGLMDYGQSAASQEYEKAYNRRLRGYETNLGREQEAYRMDLGAGERAYGLQVGSAQQAYDRQRQNALEQARLAREDAYQAYTSDYARSYQRAQDRYVPELATWQEQQRAASQAAKEKYDRQWEAYTYAQPSATEVFRSGLA
jgi:hypothetical protein